MILLRHKHAVERLDLALEDLVEYLLSVDAIGYRLAELEVWDLVQVESHMLPDGAGPGLHLYAAVTLELLYQADVRRRVDKLDLTGL